MYNINRRQYILKTSAGECMNIFYKLYTGICCSIQTDTGTWTPPNVILKNALPGFSAYLDKADNIHILCQDAKSNILYIRKKNESWNIRQVAKNPDADTYDKYPSIYAFDTNIYFFYIVENSGKKVLVSQLCSLPDYLSSLKAIDITKKSTTPFSVQGSLDGSIYLFYVRPGEKHDSSGYKVLAPDSKDWSNFNEISSNTEPVEEQILSVVTDPGENFNICIQRAWSHKYELIHIKAKIGQKCCLSETILSSSPNPFSNSSIVIVGQKLIVYWVRDGSIYYCISCDNGNTWSNAEKYQLFDNSTYYCTKLFSNSADDNKEICGVDIPASIADGFHPAFVSENRDKKDDKKEKPDKKDEKDHKKENSNTDEYKTIISNTLETIRANIYEINHAIKDTDEKLKKMESRLQELEHAFETYSIEIKNGSLELEKFKIETDMLKTIVSGIQNSETPVLKGENKTETRDAAEPDSSTPKNANGSLPVMAGAGFAQITYDYLKKNR